MANFNLAIPTILAHEGGWSDRAEDHGGPTKWGITLATFQRIRPGATKDELRDMDEDEARWIYERLYWDEFSLELVHDQVVATKIFDLFVNMSPGSAARIVQRAIRRLNFALTVDGILGPNTISAVNAADAEELVYSLVSEQRRFYEARVVEDPNQRVFLKGWLARAAWPLDAGIDSRFA